MPCWRWRCLCLYQDWGRLDWFRLCREFRLRHKANLCDSFFIFCTCNPSNDAGCEGDFECFGPDELLDVLGIYDAHPTCFLPVGALCRPETSSDCLTGICNDNKPGVCGCFPDYPCDVESGEICLRQTIGYVCMVPFPIGSDCALDSECDRSLPHFHSWLLRHLLLQH